MVFGRGTDQLEFLIQKANIPGISISDTPQPTTFGTTIPVPTMGVAFEPLTVEFIVDENLENWKTLYSWIRNLSNIDTDDQYNLSSYQSWHKVASLFVYDSTAKFNAGTDCTGVTLRIDFNYIIPTSLSGIIFQSDSTDVIIQKATCKFKYSYYDLNPDATAIIEGGNQIVT
jgi:hypothetical protein